MIRQNEELLQLLVRKNIINNDKAKEIKAVLAKDHRDQDLGEYLVRNKITDSDKVTELKAEVYNLPYKNLADEEVKEEVLNIIPKDVARHYSMVCFGLDKQTLKIGLSLFDFKAMEAVNFLAREKGFSPEYYFISEKSFQEVFRQYERMEEEISTALEIKAKSEGEDLIQVKQESNNPSMVSNEDVNSAPVAKIVSVVIRHAVEARASDIHIEPVERESRVRYRIDGILRTSLVLPLSVHNAVVARIKVLARLKLDETRVPQDGRIRLLIDGREIDFRVSTLPLASYEKVEMRILDSVKGIPQLEDLGFNTYSLEVIRRGLKKTMGIFLVTGPTGSGKSTTLYAALSILNQDGVNISTLEDPIEYQIKGINQSQVKPKIGYTFATGLRSFLRQDPNIIMVGEVRDEETAELCIHAGLTGHLVLSTLHTNDAIGSLFRLLDMKVEPFLLASTLKTVVAQRLVRRLCQYCRKEVVIEKSLSEEIMKEISQVPIEIMKQEFPKQLDFSKIENFTTFQKVGCPRCDNTGYTDRVSISEVIEIKDDIKEMIMNHHQDITIDNIKKNQKFISIKQDGFLKVLKGVTTTDEVLRVVEN